MTSFLLAVAYARKHDWASVARELQAGNKAPSCVQYLTSMGPFELTGACFATLRQLAREGAAEAPRLGVAHGAALLQSLRKMAKKVAGAIPQGMVPVVVGGHIRGTVDMALVALYEKAGRTAEAAHARRVQEADNQWRRKVRSEFKSVSKQTDLMALSARYGVTREEFQAKSGQKLSPETQRKFAAMTRFLDATEKPLAEKWLKRMPD
jgi:hypothetical protein